MVSLDKFAWMTGRSPELVRVLCAATPTSWRVQHTDHAKPQRAKRVQRGLLFLGLLAIGLGLTAGVVWAQANADPVQAEWEIGGAPEGGWTVGDPIALRLRATYPAEMQVSLPELPGEWGPFEVREQTLLPPVENEDGTFTAVREAMVVLWTPGDHATPPLAAHYRDADGQLYESYAPPRAITVASVLNEGETDKRDLKSQVSLPSPSRWPWVLGGLLLAALLGLVGWFVLTRLLRQTAPVHAPAAPLDTRSPEEIAHSELDRIAALDLPGKGKLKRHYTFVGDCMRAYVQGRYRVPALDRTTHELMTAMRQNQTNRDHTALVRDLLTQADLVKFAKARPPVAQARDTVAQARHIVDITTPPKEPMFQDDSNDL